MKIAITGGTGFIGRYLIEELLRENVGLRCLTGRKNFDSLPEYENLEYAYCDNGKQMLIDLLSGCDCLIHMGAMIPSSTIAQEDFTQQCIQNIRYCADVFDACRTVGIRNIIYTSSIAVYGNQGTQPYVETQRCDPNSIYGVTKIAVEKLAGYYHDAFGLNVKSLRIAQVFGARKQPQRPFLRMCVEKCLKSEPLIIFGTGKTTQDYIYVKDVAKAIATAVKKPELHGEYNIGIGRPVSTDELARAHCEGFCNPAGIVYRSNENEKMFFRSLDISKAGQELGWKPEYTLVQACKDMHSIYTCTDESKLPL